MNDIALCYREICCEDILLPMEHFRLDTVCILLQTSNKICLNTTNLLWTKQCVTCLDCNGVIRRRAGWMIGQIRPGL